MEAKLKEVQTNTKPKRPTSKSPAIGVRKKPEAGQTPVESVVSKYKQRREEFSSKEQQLGLGKEKERDPEVESAKYAIIEQAQRRKSKQRPE